MHRWFGSQQDSSQQAASRDQRAADRERRAARETLANLNLNPLSDEEDIYEDCNLSINNTSIFNLDGQADEESSSESDHTPEGDSMDAATLAAEKAKPFEDANFPDDEDAWKKELRIKFDRNDVEYWFNASESQMKKFGINTQWSKKDAVAAILPEDVLEECKPILRLKQDEAGPNIYKDLKAEILSQYGQRQEDSYKKALALTMTGSPSSFGKKLIHILCPGAKPLESCHCAKFIYGMWEAKLSPAIKSAIADMKFDHSTYKTIFKKADEVWRANGGSEVATVVAAVAGDVSANSTTGAVDPGQLQVSAVSRGRGGRGNFRGGRGNRGNRGNYRGNQNNSNNRQNTNSNQNQNSNSSSNQKPHQKGPRHPDGPPDSSCSRHWSQGRGATYCSDPLVCGWSNIIAPRKTNNSN